MPMIFTASFDPYSYEDWAVGPREATQAHKDMLEQYDEQLDLVDKYRARALLEPNALWSKQYLDIANLIELNLKDFDAYGLLSPSVSNRFMSIKRNANKLYPSLEAAVLREKELLAMMDANPDPRIKFTNMPTLDLLIANPNLRITPYSGIDINKMARELAAQASARNIELIPPERLNAYYDKYGKIIGYSPELMELWQNLPELANIINLVLSAYGYMNDPNLSTEYKDQLNEELRNGILEGVVYNPELTYSTSRASLLQQMTARKEQKTEMDKLLESTGLKPIASLYVSLKDGTNIPIFFYEIADNKIGVIKDSDGNILSLYYLGKDIPGINQKNRDAFNKINNTLNSLEGIKYISDGASEEYVELTVGSKIPEFEDDEAKGSTVLDYSVAPSLLQTLISDRLMKAISKMPLSPEDIANILDNTTVTVSYGHKKRSKNNKQSEGKITEVYAINYGSILEPIVYQSKSDAIKLASALLLNGTPTAPTESPTPVGGEASELAENTDNSYSLINQGLVAGSNANDDYTPYLQNLQNYTDPRYSLWVPWQVDLIKEHDLLKLKIDSLINDLLDNSSFDSLSGEPRDMFVHTVYNIRLEAINSHPDLLDKLVELKNKGSYNNLTFAEFLLKVEEAYNNNYDKNKSYNSTVAALLNVENMLELNLSTLNLDNSTNDSVNSTFGVDINGISF